MTKQRTVLGVLAGAIGMVTVGGSVAVSGVLAGSPVLTAQAVRYALACLLLLAFARVAGVRVVRPSGREWLWLGGVTALGLVIFNVALVHGSRHAEPAVLGVAVACVPLLLAGVGPMLQGRRPAASVAVAAVVVTAGAVLVEGVGRADGVGLLWAVVVLVCEAGFTLLAVPVLPRLTPWGVSVHTTWLAAVGFAAGGVVTEGPGAVTRLDGADWAAIGYLAVAVTAVAFVLWYSAVGMLGPGRAGLLTGVAPVAAGFVGVVMGAPVPAPLVWAGIGLVVLGLAIGLRPLPRAARGDGMTPLPTPEPLVS